MKRLLSVGMNILPLFLLSTLFTPWCSAAELKGGWNEFNLSTMVSGCTSAMIAPQLAEAREKSGYTGTGIPPEFEPAFKVLTGKVEEMCRCILMQTAQKWTFEETENKADSPEMKVFVDDVIVSGKCPFSFPVSGSTK